jgi:hypothetical protein
VCQEATYAPQQTAPLFDHLLGKEERSQFTKKAAGGGGL